MSVTVHSRPTACIVFMASCTRSWRELVRYRSIFWQAFFWAPVQFVVPFYFAGIAFGGTPDYQAFIFFGTLMWSWLHNSIWEATLVLSREMSGGSIELLFSTPASAPAWLLGASFASTSLHFATLCLTGGLAGFFLRPVIAPNWSAVALTLLLSYVLGWGISLTLAAATLFLKQPRNPVSLLVDFGFVVSGATFPLREGGRLLTSLAAIIPLAPAISTFRISVLHAPSFSTILPNLGLLLLLGSLFLGLGIAVLRLVHREVRQRGSLHQF
ncbi:MAG TPA: hypothetical protein DCM14_09030 [Clostridiales bacterium UBA8153]|nr:hypothetical protein [Clostridiales bacterium UBA8153]